MAIMFSGSFTASFGAYRLAESGGLQPEFVFTGRTKLVEFSEGDPLTAITAEDEPYFWQVTDHTDACGKLVFTRNNGIHRAVIPNTGAGVAPVTGARVFLVSSFSTAHPDIKTLSCVPTKAAVTALTGRTDVNSTFSEGVPKGYIGLHCTGGDYFMDERTGRTTGKVDTRNNSYVRI